MNDIILMTSFLWICNEAEGTVGAPTCYYWLSGPALLWPGQFCLDCLGEVADDYFYSCVSCTQCHSSLLALEWQRSCRQSSRKTYLTFPFPNNLIPVHKVPMTHDMTIHMTWPYVWHDHMYDVTICMTWTYVYDMNICMTRPYVWRGNMFDMTIFMTWPLVWHDNLCIDMAWQRMTWHDKYQNWRLNCGLRRIRKTRIVIVLKWIMNCWWVIRKFLSSHLTSKRQNSRWRC
jgi:hypothetical protein